MSAKNNELKALGLAERNAVMCVTQLVAFIKEKCSRVASDPTETNRQIVSLRSSDLIKLLTPNRRILGMRFSRLRSNQASMGRA